MYILIFALLIIFEIITIVLSVILGRFIGMLGLFVAMCGLLVGVLGSIIAQIDGSIIIATTYTGATYVNQTQPTYPIIFIPIILAVFNGVIMLLTPYGD